ncbi:MULTISPECIES: aldehyde dehydrogenase family protein [Phyllobacteriaceae]|jgi:aldehyde dehydrogenase (NAD+)|uniref:Aldehyde dehydrogenase n=1 Tax=Mesorhizobium hungaricum TaxID=1566387 RepID=A0A1C2DVQ5_9HYPH|nr:MULTISPECIES: aldehyde dehydrogenase family protein [Mesorhizobium]MBN9234153.1 aldehyde dehydrogenase family protein [Mesorhizobium sp.]MDQ0331689.1 aldehyde dehydrogenase (NAD+) [Mesorhizobium sp. YL-MeA3-2017]OCX18706.1 aldehyde dehydrogenase [Mesorhizobium hungaricum]
MSIAEILDTMEYGPAPESDKEARAWIKGLGGETKLFIGGAWKKAKSGESFETMSPSNGEVLTRLAQANAADIDAAVKAASKAQPAWAALPGHVRARYLYAIARLVQRHSRLFAVVETLDNGKPIRETRDIDIPLVARHFYHHAGWAQLMDGELADKEPLGVCGQIIPWNFPLLMLAWKIAPAIALGNTVVLKPAEYTSLTALLFAEICQKAGLPEGVVNIVTGDGATGEAIVNHPGVAKIAFTGSTEVGRRIREATAGSGKSLTLELGGKSPFIVFDDADLDAAVEGVVDAIWFNQGQVCCAGSRLLVQESVQERFIAKLVSRMETLRVGDPLDKAIDIGAIVHPVQLARIRELVDVGVKEGAILHQPKAGVPAKGCFYPPTLLTGVHPAATVSRVEIFGPVLVATTFRTPAEAIELANNTEYGLAASIWSETLSLALDIAPKLKCGVVWVNGTNMFDAGVGFGGYKESGYGREGGREGLAAYCKPKWLAKAKPIAVLPTVEANGDVVSTGFVDRTAKLYVGGKQARPDGGYSRPVVSPSGALVGEVGEGNRKDIRNAVEAARKATGWATTAEHSRAQILYYIAENLDARSGEFADRLAAMTGRRKQDTAREVAASVSRLFAYGAWADKFEGAVHKPPLRGVALAMNEPLGILGIACPEEHGLLGFVSTFAPAIAMGNRVVVVPSSRQALAATDFYQVLETSDVPDGVVNIVTGDRDALALELAKHEEVDGIWYFGGREAAARIEKASTGNLKQVWAETVQRDWYDARQGEGREILSRAVQVKNIWVPYGE